MPLINCEINLILMWPKNFVLTSKVTRDKFVGTGTDENPQFPEFNNPTNATFKITGTNLSQLLLYQQKMIIVFWNN